MLANQIMFLRKREGMSQLQLASKLNIGPSAIGMYEQGRRTPSIDILIVMANLFGVSLDYLITGKESIGSTAGKIEHPCHPCKARCCCCYRRVAAQEIMVRTEVFECMAKVDTSATSV